MPSPYSVPSHACPPPILSHLMPALPLYYPSPCMPSPYSIPAHACPPPILSQPMHALPLFCPIPCIPSPYSVPPHAFPPPILSQPMHALPLFYPSPCIPSPYSVPAHACLPQFYPSPCTPSSYSLSAHTCQPSILFQLMHALLTPCHIHLEGMFLLWHLHMPLLNQPINLFMTNSQYIIIIIIIYLAWQFRASLYHFMTSECLLFSFTWTHHMKFLYTLDRQLSYIYIR